MQSIKKALLPVIIMITLLLSACSSEGNEYEQLAMKAWNSINPLGDATEIYYMKFTNSNALTKEEIPDVIEYFIPQNGICIVISGPNNYASTNGLHVVFFDGKGEYLQYICSYDEYYKKYINIIGTSTDALSEKAKYLSVCNYLSGIYIDAAKEKLLSDEQKPQLNVETDKWYWINDEQVKRIIGK